MVGGGRHSVFLWILIRPSCLVSQTPSSPGKRKPYLIADKESPIYFNLSLLTVSFCTRRGTENVFAFFEERCFQKTPFFQTSFHKNCLPDLQAKFLDWSHQQFLKKLTRFFKNLLFRNVLFWPKSKHSLKLESFGLHQWIQRPPYCWCANCQLCNFLKCRKHFVFFWPKMFKRSY